MTRTRSVTAMVLSMISVMVVDACHKAPPPPPPAPVVTAPQPDTAGQGERERARRRQDSIDAANRAREAQRVRDSIDAANRAREAADRAARETADMRAAITSVIHFDFDKSDIRDDAKGDLDMKARILQANSDVMIRIAGHTDERGSDGYNLALGQRRAAATKKYLVDHGVADGRIQTVSYGEERPVAQGSNEAAWSQNRRAEFEITSGGQTLKRP